MRDNRQQVVGFIYLNNLCRKPVACDKVVPSKSALIIRVQIYILFFVYLEFPTIAR